MSTSILDLLDAAEAERDAVPADSPTLIPRAAASLGAAANLLNLLADDGIDRAPGGARERAVRNLARHCASASSMWPAESGRTAELFAAARDAVAVNRDQLGCADRWAVTLRVCTLARHATQTIRGAGPYDHLPVLRMIRTSAGEVRRHGARHPAHILPDSVLRAPIPTPLWALHAPTILQRFEHVAHQISHPRDPITITDLQAACRVAEAATALLAATSAGPATPVADAAAHRAWQQARRTLAAFTDAAPVPGQTVGIAIHACEQIESARRTGEVAETDLGQLRQYLPALATAIERELCDLPTAPLIRPGATPLRAKHITDWRDRRTVVATSADLDVVIALVRRTREASQALMQLPETAMHHRQLGRDLSHGPLMSSIETAL